MPAWCPRLRLPATNFGEQRSLVRVGQPTVKAARAGAEGTEERVLALNTEELSAREENDESATDVVVCGMFPPDDASPRQVVERNALIETDESASDVVVFGLVSGYPASLGQPTAECLECVVSAEGWAH